MKTVSRVISAAVMLVVTALLCALAKNLPMLFFTYWEPLSQKALGILGQAFGWVPLPVWEVLAALLIVWFIASLIHAIVKFKLLRWLSGAVWGAALAALLFVALWGVGHFGPTKTERIVTASPTSVARLREATQWYGAQASADAEKVSRDADGALVAADISALSDEANAAFAKLSKKYEFLPAADASVKPLFGGELFCYLGFTGIFAPYTAEPTVNPDTYAPSLPYTVCHEFAHRVGAYSEQDANFLAYLACMQSSDAFVRYSGNYSAFIYCYNALYELSPEDAKAVRASLGDKLRGDLDRSHTHYAPYEGAVQDTAQSVNDAYLKAFEEEGVASYGLVSQALVAWYEAQGENFA